MASSGNTDNAKLMKLDFNILYLISEFLPNKTRANLSATNKTMRSLVYPILLREDTKEAVDFLAENAPNLLPGFWSNNIWDSALVHVIYQNNAVQLRQIIELCDLNSPDFRGSGVRHWNNETICFAQAIWCELALACINIVESDQCLLLLLTEVPLARQEILNNRAKFLEEAIATLFHTEVLDILLRCKTPVTMEECTSEVDLVQGLLNSGFKCMKSKEILSQYLQDLMK